jgi:PhnB protein
MAQINSYLTFGGNCRDAMTFYKECLGGELTLMSVKDTPMVEQMPSHLHDSIMHSTLTKGELVLMASDMVEGGELVNGNTVSLSLSCNSEEEMNTYFTNLSNGGKVLHEPHDFFAGKIAALVDKYGKSWMLYYGTNAN